MKRVYKSFLIVLLLVVFAVSSYSASASFYDELMVKDGFSSGAVNIKLSASCETYRISRGKSVRYIPTIINRGADCYVRVSLSAESGKDSIDITSRCCNLKENWKQIGDYLYYKIPLKSGEKAEICSGFEYPQEWKYKEKNELRVKAYAEAIQEENFAPDFASATPWGNVVAVKSYVEDEYTVSAVKSSEANIRELKKDGVKGLTIDEKDFFGELMLMPGDTKTGKLKVNNTSEKTAQILFKAEYAGKLPRKSLNLRIESGNGNNKKVFYEGFVSEKELHEYREIVRIDPGKSEVLNFTLSFSKTAGNGYQLKEGDIIWHFAVYDDEKNGFVRTSDDVGIQIIAVCLALISGILIYWLMRGRLKHEK